MSRRGRKRRNRKRSERPKKPKGPQPPAVTIEETTGDEGEGVTVLEPRAVAQMRTIQDYMEAGVLSKEQVDGIYRRMAKIAALGDDRYAIPAYRVMLARAKLDHDIRGGTERNQINIDTHGGRVDVFGIAAGLGLSIDIRDDGPGERLGDVVEGSARRSQSEDDGGA